MHCAERFILATHPTLSGPTGETLSRSPSTSRSSLWSALRNKTEFIIGHPNGWEWAQQAKLRRAAVMAKLIRNTAEDMNRLRFVSEGEASLCYCIGEGVGISSRSYVRDGPDVHACRFDAKENRIRKRGS